MSTITLKNGNIYKGNLNRYGKPHGYGILNYKNEVIYQGHIVNNRFEGKGTMKWIKDKQTYSGEWKNNVRHGTGKMYYSNGTIYSGEWKNDSIHGEGIMEYKDGRQYEGVWTDKFTGKGIIYYPNNIVYEGIWSGEYRDPNGTGKMTYEKTNAEYEGNWKNGLKHGHGVESYDGEISYKGEWFENKKNGMGIYIFENGDIYEGEMKNDNIHGKGTLTLDNRNVIYKGIWKNETDGEGLIQYINKHETYEGTWKNLQKDGKGKMTYTNKDIYIGTWKKDYMQGLGRMYYADGIYDGHWEKNQRHGNGQFIYKNKNIIFYGKWKNDNKYYGNLKLLLQPIKGARDTHYGMLKLRSPYIQMYDTYTYPSVTLKCSWNIDTWYIDTLRSVKYDPPMLKDHININIHDLFDFIDSSTIYYKLDFYKLCGYIQPKDVYDKFIEKMKKYKGTVRLLAICHSMLLYEQHIPCPVTRVSAVENGICTYTKLPKIIQSIDTSLQPIKIDGSFKHIHGDYIKTIEDEMETMLEELCKNPTMSYTYSVAFFKSRKMAKCKVKTVFTRKFTVKIKDYESDSSYSSDSSNDSDEGDDALEWTYASSKDKSKKHVENEKMFNKKFGMKGKDFNVLLLIDEEGKYINLFRNQTNIIELFDILHLVKNCAECIFVDFSCSYSNFDKKRLQKYGGTK